MLHRARNLVSLLVVRRGDQCLRRLHRCCGHTLRHLKRSLNGEKTPFSSGGGGGGASSSRRRSHSRSTGSVTRTTRRHWMLRTTSYRGQDRFAARRCQRLRCSHCTAHLTRLYYLDRCCSQACCRGFSSSGIVPVPQAMQDSSYMSAEQSMQSDARRLLTSITAGWVAALFWAHPLPSTPVPPVMPAPGSSSA